MGTRGLYGFRKNGVDKTTYNHFDSYPDVLGKNILSFISEHGYEMNKIFDNIIMVDETNFPSDEQIGECKKYLDDSVGEQTEEDWYCLLRNTQGDLFPYAEDGLKYMIDNQDFILDSLWCEYAYIINLDTNKLEFWLGFQHTPDATNRYGTESFDNAREYYPCKLIKEYNLSDIIGKDENSLDEIVEDMNKESKED